jgi:Outer membrane protein beta-barrel domain
MRIQAILILTALICVVPRGTYAQVRAPGENTVAIGGNVGFHATDTGSDDEHGANLEAFAEYYYSRRASLRGTFGWAEPELQATPKRTLRQQRVLVNFVYNWPLGRFRPFATVGGGAYFLQPRQDGDSVDRRVTKPGANIGWGLEYYLRTLAVRTEMTRAHPQQRRSAAVRWRAVGILRGRSVSKCLSKALSRAVLVLVDPKSLQAGLQGGGSEAQSFRRALRAGDAPTRDSQGSFNGLALVVLQPNIDVFDGRGPGNHLPGNPEHLAVRYYDRARDEILQLSNVPRPIVSLEKCKRPPLDARHCPAEL